jgi:hypothetical protein
MIRNPAEEYDVVCVAVVGRCNKVTDAIEKAGQCFPAEFRFIASINLVDAVRLKPPVSRQVAESAGPYPETSGGFGGWLYPLDLAHYYRKTARQPPPDHARFHPNS